LAVSNVYKRLKHDPSGDVTKRRITAGITEAEMKSFIPKFEDTGCAVENLRLDEMPLAYKYFRSKAEQLKKIYEGDGQ
jgi:hypothetical protein